MGNVRGIWFPLFTPSIHCRTKPAVPVNTRGVLSCSCLYHHPPMACVSVTTKLFECNKKQDTYLSIYIYTHTHIYIFFSFNWTSVYYTQCKVSWMGRKKKTPESTSLLCQSISQLQVRRQRLPSFVLFFFFHLKCLSKFHFLNWTFNLK